MTRSVRLSVCWLIGRSVDLSVGRSVCHNFLKAGKFQFHAPIGALVYYNTLSKGGHFD